MAGESDDMHSELLMTLARIYCDNEWAVADKAYFPTEDRLGWVGLDHARLRWAIENGYVKRYVREGECRLNLTGAGRDALYNENLSHADYDICASCDGLRSTCESDYLCVDCRTSSPQWVWYENGYVDHTGPRDACGDRLPVPVMP